MIRVIVFRWKRNIILAQIGKYLLLSSARKENKKLSCFNSSRIGDKKKYEMTGFHIPQIYQQYSL